MSMVITFRWSRIPSSSTWDNWKNWTCPATKLLSWPATHSLDYNNLRSFPCGLISWPFWVTIPSPMFLIWSGWIWAWMWYKLFDTKPWPASIDWVFSTWHTIGWLGWIKPLWFQFGRIFSTVPCHFPWSVILQLGAGTPGPINIDLTGHVFLDNPLQCSDCRLQWMVKDLKKSTSSANLMTELDKLQCTTLDGSSKNLVQVLSVLICPSSTSQPAFKATIRPRGSSTVTYFVQEEPAVKKQLDNDSSASLQLSSDVQSQVPAASMATNTVPSERSANSTAAVLSSSFFLILLTASSLVWKKDNKFNGNFLFYGFQLTCTF